MRDTPIMIETFADKRTTDLHDTGRAKRFPPDVAESAAHKTEYVELAIQFDDPKVPPGNRFHSERTDVDFSHGFCPKCYAEEVKTVQKMKGEA